MHDSTHRKNRRPYRCQRAFSRRTHTLITSSRATQAPVLWVSSRTSVHRACRSWTRLTSANQPSTAPRIVWRPTGSWAPEKTAERYGIRYADGPDFCLPRFIMEPFGSIGLSEPGSRHAHDPIEPQLLVTGCGVDYAGTHSACERLFVCRQMQSRPQKSSKPTTGRACATSSREGLA